MWYFRLALMVIATILGVYYILMTVKGQKYAHLTGNLTKEQFSNVDLCAAGFAMQSGKLLAFRGRIAKKLVNEARLLYGGNDNDTMYYARLYYARSISITVMIVAIMLGIAAILGDALGIVMVAAAAVMGYAVWQDSADEMKKKLEKRREACMDEFPDEISKLALLASSGDTLYQAWEKVARSKDSEIYRLMEASCVRIRDGGTSVKDGIYGFAIATGSPEIRKFASLMIQSMEKGGSDLIGFLTGQSNELWSQKRVRMLKKGDEAAAKLLLPTVMMLCGILLIIIGAVAMSMSGSI